MGTALFYKSSSNSARAHNLVTLMLAQETRSATPVCGRRLYEALLYADDCKELLHFNEHAEALVMFVKACATSVHCLESLEGVVKMLVYSLDLLERNHRLHGQTQLPHVIKTTKLILYGFKLHAFDAQSMRGLLLTNSAEFPDWRMHSFVRRLDLDELEWVLTVGSFKASFQLAMLARSQGKVDSEVDLLLDTHVQGLLDLNEVHPHTLEAQLQYDMLFEVKMRSRDPMAMQIGYVAGLTYYHDPALAMHHVLQSMYVNLQICNASPSDAQERDYLKLGAHLVMRLCQQMQDEDLWDSVKGRLTASMLLLAHNWPLAKVLGDHTLVAFINEQHRTQREVLLSQPAMQLEVSEEEVEHISDSDTASPVKDSPGQDERKGLLRACRCTRCEKYIGKQQLERAECGQCHAVYCSSECQKKHAQDHKIACRRAKLKTKLAAKSTAK